MEKRAYLSDVMAAAYTVAQDPINRLSKLTWIFD